MKASEIGQIVRVRRPELDRGRRLVANCHDINDLRRWAKRALPRGVFDYLEGGADEETTTHDNINAFRQWQFHPSALADVAAAQTDIEFLGRSLPLPLALAPTGYSRMMHPLGEVAVARAAAAAGVPYTLSTVATSSVEDVAAAMKSASDDPMLWMQLYLFRDREQSWRLLERAYAAGASVLEFSVDTAVAGRRVRDQRNGFTIPPSLTPLTVLEMGLHPRYWTSMVRSPALTFANFQGDGDSTIASITSQFDSSLTWDDVRAVRDKWPGRLSVKGPLSPDDARRAIDAGVDIVHLSNHGGRQLDRCVPTIDLVAPARAAIGTAPLIIDSGVRHGMDIAIAIALGADLVAVGRPYLYGLAAAGEVGVSHSISLLQSQLLRTLQLVCVTSVAELRDRGAELVRRAEGRLDD